MEKLGKEDFLKKVTDVKNILIGNGFGLSHPELKKAFEWDLKEALLDDWCDIKPKSSAKCPEKDLDKIRLDCSEKILTYYIDNLKEKLGISKDEQLLRCLYESYCQKVKNINCKRFLSGRTGRSNIFTLNYDPIFYFEILKTPKTLDGFVTKYSKGDCNIHQNERYPTWLTQEFIKCQLEQNIEEYTRVFFLHGSWFIQANEKDELRKLLFGHNSEESIDSLFAGNKRPYLILEDRWRTKKGFLTTDEHPYYKYCYEQLQQIKGELLVFGCSFKNDLHIWQAIKSNNHLKTIYITYYTENDKQDIQKLIGSAPSKQHIYLIKVDKNVIWETNE